MMFGFGRPRLDHVSRELEDLRLPKRSSRRRALSRLEKWAKKGLPEGASRLLLEHASREFEAIPDYPHTPNEALIRLLWDGKASVECTEVEAVYGRMNDECRAAALRLLAETPTRPSSESLARLLTSSADEGWPKAGWPFLLPLERTPRDADVLAPALLSVVTTRGLTSIGEVLLAYAKRALLDDSQRERLAAAIEGETERELALLDRMWSESGVACRWEDEHVRVKTDVGVALDLLGWLGVRRAARLLRRAAEHPEPWVALWGSVGVLRGGEAVAPALLHRVASAADCRVALMRQLDGLGMKSLFPPEFLDQASLAEGRMVEWLAFPTELARAPDEIKLERVFAVDLDEGPADIYVYAFRAGVMSDEGWMIGVSGPYLRDAQPTIEDRGVTFSQFQNLQDKALEQHVEEIIDGVARIRRW